MGRISMLAGMLLVFGQHAHAAQVTVIVEGVVLFENGSFPGSVGQPFTGSYTFDDTTSGVGVPGVSESYPGAVSETTASFAGNAITIQPTNSLIGLQNGPNDFYSVTGSGPGTLNGDGFLFAGFGIFLDDSLTAMPGTMLDDTTLTTIPAFVPVGPFAFETIQILDLAGNPAVSASLTTLTVLVPPVEVAIDLKPGSNPSTVNLGSQGVTPLAIFGSAELDATQIDVDSLEINGDEANVAVVGNGNVLISLEDLNEDGFIDAIVKFETEGLALTDNAPLTLTGSLLDGTQFTGDQPADDPVNIVP